MEKHSNWFEKLAIKKLIEPFDTGDQVYYRLKAPVNFICRGEFIRQMIREYDPAIEKGGLLLTSVKKVGSQTTLTVEKVIFIPNRSLTPYNSYDPSPALLEQQIGTAFRMEMLPLIFHTHPTASGEAVNQLKMYHYQMETSDGDRSASLGSYEFSNGRIRLPEALIIGDGSLKKALFIGLYGGLVAPLGFKNRKNGLLITWFFKQAENVIDSINSSDKKAVAIITTIIAVIYAKDNPDKTRRFFRQLYALGSPLVYATAKENIHIGFSLGQNLKINLPKLNDYQIREEEIMATKNIFRRKVV